MEHTNRPDAFSVGQLNEYVKMVLEGNPNLKDVWVQGEISGAKLYASGHLYFSVKDEESAVSAVMFRGQMARLDFRPEDGMKVLVHGRVSAYVPRGQYQFIADRMIPAGAGTLAVAFEQLKSRLAAEGLFDPARKRPLPPHPTRIGVVTSPSGAAVHDMSSLPSFVSHFTSEGFPATSFAQLRSTVTSSDHCESPYSEPAAASACTLAP